MKAFFLLCTSVIVNYMNSADWYLQLQKPTWAPPSIVFGPVWTVLYILILISYAHVVKLFLDKQISFMVLLPFLLNIIFNIVYTPIQFGLKNLPLATIDILLVLGTLVWALVAIYPHARWVVYINIPYLLWVMFATFLQIAILRLN
jgi:translocator protein